MRPPVTVWMIPNEPPPERWGWWKRWRARRNERRWSS